MRALAAVGLLCMLTVTDVFAQNKLQVTPDRQNVVASRLVGEWEADSALTARLGGAWAMEGVVGEGAGGAVRIAFRSDSTVAAAVPAAWVESVLRQAAFPVYLAGRMRVGQRDLPFVLTTASGNTHLVFWLERRGDPFGNSESFLLAVAAAKEPANDILFIGGDFNNQPFSALRRVAPRGASQPR